MSTSHIPLCSMARLQQTISTTYPPFLLWIRQQATFSRRSVASQLDYIQYSSRCTIRMSMASLEIPPVVRYWRSIVHSWRCLLGSRGMCLYSLCPFDSRLASMRRLGHRRLLHSSRFYCLLACCHFLRLPSFSVTRRALGSSMRFYYVPIRNLTFSLQLILIHCCSTRQPLVFCCEHCAT